MKNRLSDEHLIDCFVQESIQNREVLLANLNLAAQSVTQVDQSKINQLQTKTAGMIAFCRLDYDYPEFLIRRESDYWVLLNQTLTNHGFLRIEDTAQQPTPSAEPAYLQPFASYQYVKMPPGYRMACTPALELWRKWWKYSRRVRSRPGLSMDLVVRVRQTWYPIKDLAVSNGLIFIKTLIDETTLHSEDLIVWLEKETNLVADPT
ncbi:MAG: hypothetical protein AB4042_16910 [Leptolyngbyaceae cyanobacterium]